MKIACTEENQVLEFYIKLRIAIAKGGIYIIPVEEITIGHSIRKKIKGLRRHDYITQSNALYTLLSNESIVSTDFTMGQNCILSNSTTMDGFSALKTMLKRTLPTLTKRRPPAEAPKLDNYDNLHMYEQGIRNHYLLHELFNGNTYSPLESAKEFIRGIRETTYDNAVKRIQTQLDTAENMDMDIHKDYTLQNIATTIINMTEMDNTDKVIVRTMTTGYLTNNRYQINSRRQGRYTSRDRRATPYQLTRNRDTKFVKTRCPACKTFGHDATQC